MNFDRPAARVTVVLGCLLTAVGLIWSARALYVAVFPSPRLERSWLPMGLAMLAILAAVLATAAGAV